MHNAVVHKHLLRTSVRMQAASLASWQMHPKSGYDVCDPFDDRLKVTVCDPFDEVYDPFDEVCDPFDDVCDPFDDVCDAFYDVCDPFDDVCDPFDDRLKVTVSIDLTEKIKHAVQKQDKDEA